MSASQDRPEIVQRLERRREAYADHGRVYRIAWVVAGFLVIAAGIAMIVFPGPAVVVIPLGLAMLSFEFAWAQSLLDKGLEGGVHAKDKVAQASRRQKELLGVAVVCAIAAVITLAVFVLT